jgi:hypothetical protein
MTTTEATLKALQDRLAKLESENASLKASTGALSKHTHAELRVPYKGKTLVFTLALDQPAGAKSIHILPRAWADDKEAHPSKLISGMLDGGKLYLPIAEADKLIAEAK